MQCPNRILLTTVGLSLWLVTGCGRDNPSSAPQAKNDAARGETAAAEALPTASLRNPQSADPEDPVVPEKGSPEWIVGEIIHLRSQPLPDADDPQQRADNKRQRSRKIIELAQSVIAQTHNQPDQERTFDDGVHLLVEARRELALMGDPADVEDLYNDAAALYERNSESKAAAEAAFSVVQLARTNASRYSKQEPTWLLEFARQARQYATRFPRFQSRAATLLDSAAWSCELHGLTDEAITCYTQLKQQFPDSPQAGRVDGILRRLSLKGTRLELGGETVDGGYFKIDQWHGRVVLVVFWESKTRGVREKLAQAQDALEKHEAAGFSVVGVSLDEDPAQLKPFLQEIGIRWPQIFSADPEQRGWHNPVAHAYGIRNVPAFWLVDPNGIVVDLAVDPQTLDVQIAKLRAKPR